MIMLFLTTLNPDCKIRQDSCPLLIQKNYSTKQCISNYNSSLFIGRSVLLLLSQGACPDLVGSKGVAAVHLAAGKETEKNTRCLKMLLRYGADPNIRYGYKYWGKKHHDTFSDKFSLHFLYLYNHRTSLFRISVTFFSTGLTNAALYMNVIQIVKLSSIDVLRHQQPAVTFHYILYTSRFGSMFNFSHNTLLNIFEHNEKVIMFCKVVNYCISLRSSDGLTPLHIAALWGCYQNLKLLLMNGGNPNIKHKVSVVLSVINNFP